MKCVECRKPITTVAARKAVPKRNDEGKIVGYLHRSCAAILAKRKQQFKRRESTVGNIYDEAATHRNRTDISIEEERAKASLEARQRDDTEHFTDWRDPDTFEV